MRVLAKLRAMCEVLPKEGGMKGWGRYALVVLCAPWDLVLAAFFALAAWPLGLALEHRRGVLWARLPARGRLAQRWRYSTTLGHLVLLQEHAQGTDVEDHELVHVRQYEAAVLGVWLAGGAWAVLSALCGGLAAAATLLLLGPWWGYFGASAAAALRGGEAYRDNAFERHARAEVALLGAALHGDPRGRTVLGDAPQASSENGVKSVSRS
jgi:hypothetical protein